jgi:hypothetical protein
LQRWLGRVNAGYWLPFSAERCEPGASRHQPGLRLVVSLADFLLTPLRGGWPAAGSWRIDLPTAPSVWKVEDHGRKGPGGPGQGRKCVTVGAPW